MVGAANDTHGKKHRERTQIVEVYTFDNISITRKLIQTIIARYRRVKRKVGQLGLQWCAS